MPQCFRILPRLDQFRNWLPTLQQFCNKCYVLANFSVKKVSVTSGGFKCGGWGEERLKRGPFDDVIIFSQP